MSIPTVGVVDSNCDPTYVTYPIPANDDSADATAYVLRLADFVVRRAKHVRDQHQQVRQWL